MCNTVGELIDTIEYDYPTFHLAMDCFWAEVVSGNLVLKEHESAADDEERSEIGVEGAGLRPGNEEQGADAKEQQTEHHAQAVATAVDEPARRDGHDEIAQIGGHLDERRLGDADVERVLEMLVEHIEDGAGEAPQEEERCDQDEG